MADREDIKQVIGYLKLAFPNNYNPDVTSQPNTVDVMLDLLGHFPAELLRLAVRSTCAQPGRAFAPAPGEIRGEALSLLAASEGLPTAGDAWREVMRAVNDVGCQNNTPTFSHPLVKRAVQAIGFRNIGMSENVSVERAHFLKIYAEMLEESQRQAARLPEAQEFIRWQLEQRRQKELGVGDITRS
jgi:hypothetical protein